MSTTQIDGPIMQFVQKVNAVSEALARLSNDPAERMGIAVAIMEIYRFELTKNFIVVPVDATDNNTKESSDGVTGEQA